MQGHDQIGPQRYRESFGRYYDDFNVGDVYEHRPGRTITESDNTWFTLLTMNTHPLHFDKVYAAKSEFKQPLVNSCLTLSMVVGMSVSDITSITMWSKQPEPTIQAVDFFYGPLDFDEFLVFPGADWTFFDITSQLRVSGNLEAIRIWGYSGGGPNEDLTRVDDVVIEAEVANATEAGSWGKIKGLYR